MSKTKATAESLSRLLADSYTVYLKTHNFHWNVKGPMFSTLHLMFETQYTEQALAVDEIAERIRSLGHPAPGSYAQFSELTSVKEADGVPKAEEMIRQLAGDQKVIVAAAKDVVKAAEAINDIATIDLATRRVDVHEKNAWMLNSMLE